jgi:type VI secretion system protein ImpG
VFNKYYQDELVYLRDMGREFADSHPEAARFLAEPGSDPDVERMLEGFAFLTAKLRQKLDDELPEFTHALTEMLWPHYLRPVPSATVIQFDFANRATAERKALPGGIEVDSTPVDGTRCRFRTCYGVELLPLELSNAELRREAPARLRLKLDAAGKLSLDKLGVHTLRLHLTGEAAVSRRLYVALLRMLKRVVVRRDDGSEAFTLPASSVKPVGFAQDEGVLSGPGPSFQGFRLLQEYFAVPFKFLFVDVTGLEGLAPLEGKQTLLLDFEFSRLPEGTPPVSKANLALNCAPAVNVFKHDADPIRLDRARTEYTLRPAGDDPRHYEIFHVDRVYGLEVGTAEEVEFHPQYRLARSGRREELFFHTRRQPALTGGGSDMLITFLDPTDVNARRRVETVSVELLCTNGMLPARLDSGDVSVKTAGSPVFATFRNLTRPTPTIPPPLGGDLHWRLIAHLSLNYLSLLSVESLRALIGLYNFRAGYDRNAQQAHARLLESIQGVTAAPATRLLNGAPLRGLEIVLTVDEDLVGGEGEMFLLGSVLNEFFAQYVTLNAFTRLSMKGAKFGESFEWTARLGSRDIL